MRSAHREKAALVRMGPCRPDGWHSLRGTTSVPLLKADWTLQGHRGHSDPGAHPWHTWQQGFPSPSHPFIKHTFWRGPSARSKLLQGLSSPLWIVFGLCICTYYKIKVNKISFLQTTYNLLYPNFVFCHSFLCSETARHLRSKPPPSSLEGDIPPSRT